MKKTYTDGSLCIVALLYTYVFVPAQNMHKINWVCKKYTEQNLHCKKEGHTILSEGGYFTSPLWRIFCLNRHLASVSCPQWYSSMVKWWGSLVVPFTACRGTRTTERHWYTHSSLYYLQLCYGPLPHCLKGDWGRTILKGRNCSYPASVLGGIGQY